MFCYALNKIAWATSSHPSFLQVQTEMWVMVHLSFQSSSLWDRQILNVRRGDNKRHLKSILKAAFRPNLELQQNAQCVVRGISFIKHNRAHCFCVKGHGAGWLVTQWEGIQCENQILMTDFRHLHSALQRVVAISLPPVMCLLTLNSALTFQMVRWVRFKINVKKKKTYLHHALKWPTTTGWRRISRARSRGGQA